MKRYAAMMLAAMLICLALLGCAKPTPPAGTTPTGNTQVPPAQAGKPHELYADYIGMKTALVSRLADALAESYPMEAMSFLGLAMIDLALIPMTAIGLEEDVLVTTLSFFKVADIEYQIDANTYTVNYKDGEGNPVRFQTVFDPAKQAAATTMWQSGEQIMVFEYAKTPYGYASQYYSKNDDGTYSLYKGTFYNEGDGVLGISEEGGQPAPLPAGAGISKDFPKDCESWYAADGAAGTGKNADGQSLEFAVPDQASD